MLTSHAEKQGNKNEKMLGNKLEKERNCWAQSTAKTGAVLPRTVGGYTFPVFFNKARQKHLNFHFQRARDYFLPQPNFFSPTVAEAQGKPKWKKLKGSGCRDG